MSETYQAFDAGILNDHGGGDIGWWQDYLRSVIEQANENGRAQLAAAKEREEQLQSDLNIERAEKERAMASARMMLEAAKEVSARNDKLRERYSKAKARIVELEAVVERLPKTADGVRIVPGMKLWHCPDYETPSKVSLSGLYCMGSGCYSPACQSDSSSGTHQPFCNCHSTREAAAAARKAVQ